MNLERDVAPTGFYDYLPRMGTIRRRAYSRKSYTRKTGTKVHGSRVRAKMIKDVGAPGKWRARHMGAPGIGKLKPGLMKAVGYDVNASVTRRHKAVKAAVKKYGKSSTIKKLNAVAVYTRRTSPAKSKKFKADMKFAQKMKGGEGRKITEEELKLETIKGKLEQEDELAAASDEQIREVTNAGVTIPETKPNVGNLVVAIKTKLSELARQ